MQRARVPILLGLGVFFAAATLGVWASLAIPAPERLRVETERVASKLMRSEVSVGAVWPVLFDGIGLDGSDLSVYESPAGPRLRVERVSVRFRPLSLLSGRPRLSRLSIDGAHLRVDRDAEGRYQPEPFARFDPKPEDESPEHRDELLSPLIGLEAIVRWLLEQPRLADRLEVHRGEVVFADAGLGGRQATLTLVGLRGSLRHSRLRGNAKMEARARLTGDAGARCSVEWEGRREREGSLRLAMAASDLQLASVAPWLRPLHPTPLVEGAVSGVAVYETPEAGRGRLELDLVGRDVKSVAVTRRVTRSAAPRGESADDPAPPVEPVVVEPFGRVRAERLEMRGALEIAPQHVRLEDARLATGELAVTVDGTLSRPLSANSAAQLQFAVENVDVADVRHAIGWLPAVEREEAAGLLRPVRSGHLDMLRIGGEATLAGWQDFLAGRTRRAPRGWVADVHVADAVVKAGDADLIENLSGRVWWSGERVEVRGARAMLGGESLPVLDVTLDGITNFIVVDPAQRALHSGGPPMIGLRALWEVLFASDDPTPPEMRAAVQLDIEHLEHPMFLWPIRDLRAAIEPIEGGVHILTTGGTWAGVPVRGDADWLFEPTEEVRVRLTASRPTRGRPPPPAPPVSVSGAALPAAIPEAVAEAIAESEPPAAGAKSGAVPGGEANETDPAEPAPSKPVWALGSFAVGEVREERWLQKSARGSFVARGGEVEITEAEIELLPTGRIGATGLVDLARDDAVPLEVDFALVGGDVSALAGIAGLPPEVASGKMDAGGSFRAVVRPGQSVFSDLRGRLGVLASNGQIRRAVPAVVAVALASQAVNPFAKRESVRYDRLETLIEFEDGGLRTDSLAIDGPDVRAFASGSAELAEEPHDVDVKVVLYLFRQVDTVLEKIPIVNMLLLGPDQSLAAAYFSLTGPWDDPVAEAIPLASIASSMPGSGVIQGLQAFVMKGIEMIEAMVSRGAREEPADLEPDPPAES